MKAINQDDYTQTATSPEEENDTKETEDKLSIDEIRSFLGRDESTESEESLVEPGDRLLSDRQGLNEHNNTFRILSALLLTTLAGFAVVFVASLYSGIGKGTKVVESQEESPEVAEEPANKEDELKAQLAWAQQEADLAPEPQLAIEPEPEPEPEAVEPKPQPRPTPTRPAPEKEVDPLEEWARLASVGVGIGNNEIEQPEAAPVASSVNTRPSKPDTSRPTIQDTVPTKTATNPSPSRPSSEENRLVASTDITSVSLGKPKIEPELEPEPLDINSQEVQDFLSGRSSQSEQLARLASAGTVSSFSSSQSKAEVQKESIPAISSKQIPFGTTAKGEFASTIIWSQGMASGTSRGKIVLKEALLAEDGSVAIEANSTLIVQVDSIQNSGLSQLEVIAISYTDSSGTLKQESVPPGTISIRGKNNSPLIADRANGNGGSNLGQDALMAVLGAGERGFEVLNEPSVDYGYTANDYFDDDDDEDEEYGYDYSSFSSRRRGEESSLVTGAAQGVFETTKERLEERSKQMASERANETPIYQLKEGEEIAIFVNSFLEINK